MKIIVGVKSHFDAAHLLPNYDGKCKNMHGHTWHVEVGVIGYRKENGMVMDLSELKEVVYRNIHRLDHKMLNDEIDATPTCENILLFLRDQIQKDIYPIELCSVKVREGEGGWARWQV